MVLLAIRIGLLHRSYAEYVKEAKQRGLTCGVKSTSIDKTCSQDVLKCTPSELCEAATYT